MSIRVLPPEIASKIAAGEVVERPASVVRELLDNALDAGATRIAVEVQAGGVRLIRVVDNGVGIAHEDVPRAFERFATSKIRTVEDLENISSLGFRGEALPSIAAVSDVTMVTRCRDDMAGTFIEVKDGSICQKARRGCPVGTTVTVRNLFRSFPARLKFLKTTATENGHISQLVSQYSISFPGVSFTLVIDGRTAFRTAGSGNMREVLAQVYGVETARLMLSIEPQAEGDDAQDPLVSGFVSPPSLTRATRSYISFFVNGRWVQNRMLMYALEEAYRGLLMNGRHPVAAVNISISPQEVDINVHPAKSEVKFRHEREVFSAVQKRVRTALLALAPMPSLDTLAGPRQVAVQPPERFSDLEEGVAQSAGNTPVAGPPVTDVPVKALPVLRVVGQVAGMYIITEGPDGMYLVDQHAAHERILFEKIREQRRRRSVEIQGMLHPVTVELTLRQKELLEQHSEALAQYGFDIEHFGDRACLVRSVPAVLRGQNVAQSLLSLLDFLGEDLKGDWDERIAVSLACHSAVLAGRTLSHEEMQDLIRQLENTSQPRNCPHGRPTMIHLSASQLEKGFGRR